MNKLQELLQLKAEHQFWGDEVFRQILYERRALRASGFSDDFILFLTSVPRIYTLN